MDGKSIAKLTIWIFCMGIERRCGVFNPDHSTNRFVERAWLFSTV
jgi:hypothetical protein